MKSLKKLYKKKSSLLKKKQSLKNMIRKLKANSKKRQKGGSPASNHVNSLLKADCKAQVDTPITPRGNENVVGFWKTTGGGKRKKRKSIKKGNKKK